MKTSIKMATGNIRHLHVAGPRALIPVVSFLGITLPLMSETSWKLYQAARRWVRKLLRLKN